MGAAVPGLRPVLLLLLLSPPPSGRTRNNENEKTANNIVVKYRRIANSHIFVPVAIESAKTWNHQAVELVQELGRRMTVVTEDPREATYLFQRMSVALQRGNAVSFHSTFTTE